MHFVARSNEIVNVTCHVCARISDILNLSFATNRNERQAMPHSSNNFLPTLPAAGSCCPEMRGNSPVLDLIVLVLTISASVTIVVVGDADATVVAAVGGLIGIVFGVWRKRDAKESAPVRPPSNRGRVDAP
ncbi:hypothetical protein [Nocardia sp. bgisy134]|uniref:hypothetical protein n=1 Tax=Nocardia sp. bgisy134 TaxID=3413789 RepID=UPI003D712B2D